MSFQYNRTQVAGNLTRDAEVRTTKNGKLQVGFTVATNRKNGDESIASYFRCTWYGETAQKVAQYLKKGKPVFVEGAVELNEYEGDDGVKHANLQLFVHNLTLLPDGKRDENGASPAATVADDDDGDVPF